VKLEDVHDKQVPSLLTLCTDRESKQWAGINYLRHKLDLNIEALPDYFHMSWNDMMNSMASIGLLHQLHRAVAIHNCAYGPWQKGAFFQDMADCGKELSAFMDSDDPLLLRLWAAICHDRGWLSEAETDAAARTQFLTNFASLPFCNIKGPKASMSRFFSVMQSVTFWDQEWHSKLLLLVFMGFRRHWISDAADIWPLQATVDPQASLVWQVGSALGALQPHKGHWMPHNLHVSIGRAAPLWSSLPLGSGELLFTS